MCQRNIVSFGLFRFFCNFLMFSANNYFSDFDQNVSARLSKLFSTCLDELLDGNFCFEFFFLCELRLIFIWSFSVETVWTFAEYFTANLWKLHLTVQTFLGYVSFFWIVFRNWVNRFQVFDEKVCESCQQCILRI